ncbi:MAG: tetratricopeptide repeat protein [Prevotella sp.]|nr:tetratricopeptide repeat protein [Prevotella sp.]
MSFWKAIFGGKELTPEEEKKEAEDKNFDLLKYDGIKAMKIGRADYAVRCFEEALKMRNDLEVRDYLQQVLIRQGDLEGAMSQLEIMTAAEPDNLMLNLQMAHVAYMMEDYDRMEQICSALDPNADERVLLMLAQAMLGKNQPEKAIEHLNTLITNHDDYADARLLRSKTLLNLGFTDEADADAMWLLEFAGGHEDVLLLKAQVETAKGQQETALKLYDMAIEVNPFSAEAFRRRGELYMAMGRTDKAESDLQQAKELNPEQDNEDIEQQVKEAYKNASPFGV